MTTTNQAVDHFLDELRRDLKEQRLNLPTLPEVAWRIRRARSPAAGAMMGGAGVALVAAVALAAWPLVRPADGRLRVTVLGDAIAGVDLQPGDAQRAIDEMRARGAGFDTP